jgi:hypothetical protein
MKTKKARRGSLKRAVQDLAPLVTPIMTVAELAIENDVPDRTILDLVRAALRGARERAEEATP